MNVLKQRGGRLFYKPSCALLAGLWLLTLCPSVFSEMAVHPQTAAERAWTSVCLGCRALDGPGIKPVTTKIKQKKKNIKIHANKNEQCKWGVSFDNASVVCAVSFAHIRNAVVTWNVLKSQLPKQILSHSSSSLTPFLHVHLLTFKSLWIAWPTKILPFNKSATSFCTVRKFSAEKIKQTKIILNSHSHYNALLYERNMYYFWNSQKKTTSNAYTGPQESTKTYLFSCCQGSTSHKILGIIPFDAQNHVKCAFWRVRLHIRTLIKRYDHVRVYSQKGMAINDLETAAFMPFTNRILQVQKMTDWDCESEITPQCFGSNNKTFEALF
jgi:hypothetical protein